MVSARGLVLGLAVSLVVACGSSGSGGSGTGGSTGSGGGTSDAKADSPPPGQGCVQAGGVCGCAGGCDPGYHLAPAPLTNDCPQPCDTCGGCSQQCCLPNAAEAGSDAGGDGGCTGSFSCLCGNPVCVNGKWECEGSCADSG